MVRSVCVIIWTGDGSGLKIWFFSWFILWSWCAHMVPFVSSGTSSPCIMCVQYRGGAQYRGGCSVPWGISWVPWGDILSTVGVVQYRGGYHDKCGRISWVLWGVQYCGGYHEYCGGLSWVPWGCSVPWGLSWCTWGIPWVPWRVFSTVGGKSFVIWVPHGTEHPPWYSWYPPTCIMISPTVLKFQWMISPHGTEHPPQYSWYPPHASWYPPWYWTSPTVLKITPHGTHDIPHGTQDIPPHLSWYPPWYWTPHGTEDIPPWYSWYPPRYWTPPPYWAPPTVLHTHYTGWSSFPNQSFISCLASQYFHKLCNRESCHFSFMNFKISYCVR